jgi:membrane glycosyltransferase
MDPAPSRPAAGASHYPTVVRDARGRSRILTTPPLNRSPMAPLPWQRTLLQRLFGGRRYAAATFEAPDPRGFWWHRVAVIRRFCLLVLVICQTIVATHFMGSVLPYQGREPLEIAILVLFVVLFAWVSAGFWTAIAGFVILMRGDDRYSISTSTPPDRPVSEDARTAIVMPIYNENVARVFAGLRATYESLQDGDRLDLFDFFVLSDSSDPDTCVAELHAWLQLCRAVGGFGRIFYRRRQHRIKRKSGNIADFCRRWGKNYRYMVVLDADSVMAASCLTRLVQLMEANPNAGIIQTAPRAAGRETLYARVQQFANRLYGPLFTAGLHFWQLGESHYWGHNAIIRIAPFMRHCALSRLPGSGALSGEILSHDFVEAALMRRAGWAVWLAYDLPGSYEEMPPNLVDELSRDRRWCQGNLMNFRLFLMKGLHPAHRAVFMTGVMAYLSAPLWFLFLALSTALLAVHTLAPPKYFVHPFQLFPLWPEWRPELAIALFGTTAGLLLLPKFLSIVLVVRDGARSFGGATRVCASMLAETVFSALLAPIRMLFHTQFVAGALSGWTIQWKSPPREDAETGWGEALRRHGWQTVLGVAWAAGVYQLNPSFLWWLAPIVGALIVSIPLSVVSSKVTQGRATREDGLFLIPEELYPPQEILRAHELALETPALPGFTAAVADPAVNALACAVGNMRAGQANELRRESTRYAERALVEGPQALPASQKLALINDPAVLSRLHIEVTHRPDAAPLWLAAAGQSAPRREFSVQTPDTAAHHGHAPSS